MINLKTEWGEVKDLIPFFILNTYLNMANINKIRISGTSYDIQDSNAPKVVELTQAQYDALVDKDPNVFYIITDASQVDLSQYWTSAQTNTAISQATSGKTNQSDFTGHTADTSIHVTTAQTAAWDAKSDFSGSYNDLTNKLSAGTNITIVDNVISATGGGGGGNVNVVELTQAQYEALTTVDPDTIYVITDAQGGDLANYMTSAQTTSAITQATSGKQDVLVSGTNIKTINNQSLLGSGNIDIQGGGGGGKAVSGGTNISITTGETADTINCTLPITVSKNGNQNEITFNNVAKFNVRGYSGGAYAVAIGDQTVSNGKYAIAIGYGARTNYNQSFSYGYYSITNNQREFSTGSFNNSVSASTTFGDSGNTLFSVGNGTSSSARHNAFEIRQDGSIFITSGGTDIKLQDHLGGGGGGGSSYTAGDGIDITNNVISVTGKVDTSAITTAITSSSTDAQVPSAKAVYDIVGNIETLLSQI